MIQGLKQSSVARKGSKSWYASVWLIRLNKTKLFSVPCLGGRGLGLVAGLGGVGRTLFPQEFDRLLNQGSPFVLFWNIRFGWLTFKVFGGACGSNFILISKGSARRKKRNFWTTFSKNCLKTSFLALFLKILQFFLKIAHFETILDSVYDAHFCQTNSNIFQILENLAKKRFLFGFRPLKPIKNIFAFRKNVTWKIF